MHLVGFTIEIYYDARPYERQTSSVNVSMVPTYFAEEVTPATRLRNTLLSLVLSK